MLTVDGTLGEGGGQILRTALSLSLVLGVPFRIVNLRAGRPRPGLRPQHLACVQAAGAVGDASVTGAAVESRELVFAPRALRGGDYRLDIGSAGSVTLVAQTLLPALLRAPEPSRLELVGGTHNPLAPPFEFLDRAFLPLLRRMGARVRARIERPGYYPRGGGRIVVEVDPVARLAPLSLHVRGQLERAEATAVTADLPAHIAERELAVVGHGLGWTPAQLRRRVDPAGCGPGNALLLELAYAHVTEVIAAFGQRGVPAEAVADQAVRAARAYLAHDAPVGIHLADQLLPYLALAGGSFTTSEPSLHARTNALVIDRFLPGALRLRPAAPGSWRAEATTDTDSAPSASGASARETRNHG